VCNPRKSSYLVPATVAEWQARYEAQVKHDRQVVDRYARLRNRQAFRVNLPAWIVTFALLALAGLCYLAKAIGWVSTPNW